MASKSNLPNTLLKLHEYTIYTNLKTAKNSKLQVQTSS